MHVGKTFVVGPLTSPDRTPPPVSLDGRFLGALSPRHLAPPPFSDQLPPFFGDQRSPFFSDQLPPFFPDELPPFASDQRSQFFSNNGIFSL